MAPRFKHGSRIGPYTVLDCLAGGGMAEVYLALNTGPSGFARVLALKVVLPNLAREQSFAQMFEDEARIAGLLNHPGVVQVFDFGVDGDVQYMAMEYVDGPNLFRTVRQLRPHGRVPTHLALRVAADVCAALEYAHTLRVGDGEPLRFVHRDVSLENVLVSYAGQTKVADFGIAKARTAVNVTRAGTLKGKHSYLPPEVFAGQGLDHRADIFGMGVTLYAMLTGAMPFRGPDRTPPTAPGALCPEISVELERLVLRALEKDPAKRFQSAAQMRDELEELMRRTRVGLPHELAAFLAEVFPEGADPLRVKYRAAVDLCARMSQGLPGPWSTEVAAPSGDAPLADISTETDPFEEPVADPPAPDEPDEPDDGEETTRYPPLAKQPTATAEGAFFSRQHRSREEVAAPPPRRSTLLPLIAFAALFLIVAICLVVILARF